MLRQLLILAGIVFFFSTTCILHFELSILLVSFRNEIFNLQETIYLFFFNVENLKTPPKHVKTCNHASKDVEQRKKKGNEFLKLTLMLVGEHDEGGWQIPSPEEAHHLGFDITVGRL